MGNAFQKAFTQLRGSSELRLSPDTTSGLPRALPLGFAMNVWLTKLMLFGALFIAIATIIFAVGVPKGSLPIFVALWLDNQTAKGGVDSVQPHQVTKSNGMKVTHYEIRYHFTLQNGQQLDGECHTSYSSLKKGEQVDVEYHPKRPELNRIRGTTAKSDANSPVVLCPILLAFGSAAIAADLRQAFVTSNLLKSGILGTAVITHCKKSTFEAFWEFNGFRWTSPRRGKGPEILLADYQRNVLDEHRRQFDSNGQYIGTALVRNFLVMAAAIFGVVFFGSLALAFSAIFFGAPRASIILGTACVGTVVGALVEMRWCILLRSLLRSNSSKKQLEDVEPLFKERICILQFQAVGRVEPVRIQKELDLQGNASDSLSRPILYLQRYPTNAKLIDSLEITSSSGPKGELTLIAHSPLPQLIALLLIATLAAIVTVVSMI